MRSALALCLLILTLTACGAASRDSAEEFKGEQAAVAAAVEQLETAARDNDAGETCTKLFSSSLLVEIKADRKDCEAAVEDAFKDADSVDLTVEAVSINGTKATARVTSGTGSNEKIETLTLEKVGAGWRISSL